MGGTKRHHNKSRKEAKKRSRAKRDKQELLQLNANSIGSTSSSIVWDRVKYSPHNLYPGIPWENDRPVRGPTAAELQSAYKEVSSFRLLESGLHVIRDPVPDPVDKKKKSIIAIIEFTRFEDLTDAQKDDLNFISTFLHQSKRFINPVSSASRAWGGLMYAIGWRKSCDKDQIVGKYIKQFNTNEMVAFDKHYSKSSRLGSIIGNLFKNLASIPFQNNHNLMKEHNLPSFASLSYGELPDDSTCSPHITFTTKSFYNPPHIDKKDVSQYAFALFIPTRLSDGSLVDSSEYDVTSGPFIFPDHQFGINLMHNMEL
ncbi:hypothetical protein PCANC_05642 [Puccinia coronata f. sp. avenae]|uniref:Tet-like 2OG-Fe(II) oxygenase domain-containing protein n=1 Tax=Puccinia coronata f. sp. avenae TaxID=200324 RepID=A0A2N5VWX9_9BASI|nr:hypothetical protein PCANC_05642 [Puccinia coronata f. sp. avenae]